MRGKPARSAEEILAYIDQHGVEKKDRGNRSADKRISTGYNRRSRKPRMVLDLHGLRSDEAQQRLRSALDRCRDTGMAELLVIHGYGRHSDPSEGPVLKKLVHELLEYDLNSLYRSYRTAVARDGGEGATIIIIR